MKKLLTGLTLVLLLLAALGYFFREPLKAVLYDIATRDMYVAIDNDSFDPGISMGQPLPAIKATYAGETIHSLAQFAGANGLAVFAVRSISWCPFCITQSIQLQDYAERFADAGIGVVVITYDSPELQKRFVERHGISYPLIADIDATSMRALGILNADIEPGDRVYGIPYPGVFVADPAMNIVGKLFLADFQFRVEADAVLQYAKQQLERRALSKQ